MNAECGTRSAEQTGAGWIATLENGEPVYRRASEEELDLLFRKAREVDEALGQKGKSEGTRCSMLWLYHRCGGDELQKRAAERRVFNRPAPALVGAELFHQPQPHHQFKQLALLLGHGVKNLFKRIWHGAKAEAPRPQSQIANRKSKISDGGTR